MEFVSVPGLVGDGVTVAPAHGSCSPRSEPSIVDIREFLESERFVLVDHAYAGMVISGVAEVWLLQLGNFVYVNGFGSSGCFDKGRPTL